MTQQDKSQRRVAFRLPKNNRDAVWFVGIWGAVAIAFFAFLGATSGGGSSKPETDASKAPDSAASSAPAPSSTPAHIEMIRGSGSDNSCEESDGEARIYVMITLRNTGDQDGTVNPWASFDYSDGGNSTEDYYSNYGHDFTVPAHSVVDATFYHTFNPQQHSMIRCAGSRDLGDSNAPAWYMPVKSSY